MRHKSRSPKAHKNVDYFQLYTHSHSVPIHISSLASFIATSFASHSCLMEINISCKFSKSKMLWNIQWSTLRSKPMLQSQSHQLKMLKKNVINYVESVKIMCIKGWLETATQGCKIRKWWDKITLLFLSFGHLSTCGYTNQKIIHSQKVYPIIHLNH